MKIFADQYVCIEVPQSGQFEMQNFASLLQKFLFHAYFHAEFALCQLLLCNSGNLEGQ